MALRAVIAELSAVDVGVTIRALLANVGENRFCVASRAGYFFVHAAEWIAGAVVIEFRYGSNGTPACICMAIFAGNGQGTVRTPAGLSLSDCRQDEG